MKVAIVHYWLVAMRGGEKVVEQLCASYPDADVFTHVFDEKKISPAIRSRIKGTTFIAKLPFASRFYKLYLPLMPWALEQIDLKGYDLVISSESGPAKGVLVPADALHVCYCHSPMRYIWEMYHEYAAQASWTKRWGLRILAHYLRMHDVTSSARVDLFVANSACVARRIKRCYNRDAEVVFPPVDTDTYQANDGDAVGDFYLMIGELVAYKRFDLGIEAARTLGRKLVIVGSGEQQTVLSRMAGPDVILLGSQSTADLRRLYATCRALIFPGEEDFGIVPIEAMASGRPVIAYGRGGAVETVKDNVSGLFFESQTVPALCEAMLRFEARRWDPVAIRAHAQGFAAKHFRRKMRSLVAQALADRAGPRVAGRPDAFLAATERPAMELVRL